MTKSLHRALDRREGWESLVDLNPYARKELEFWKNNVSHLNSSCFADAVRRPSRIVFSDTSAVGCAAFIAIDDNPVSHKNWDSLFHVESRLDFRRSLGSTCLGGERGLISQNSGW